MRWTSYFLAALGLFSVVPASSSAQEVVPIEQFSAERFSPAPGAGNYVMVDGAVVGGHMAPTFGLLVDYAHRPFVVFTADCPGGDEDDCSVDESEVDIVSYRVTGNMMGTLAFANRFQVGLVVPVVATSGDSYAATTPGRDQPYIDVRGGQAVGLGDPRLSFKAHLVGKGALGFQLAAAAYLTAPLGDATAEGHNLGDDGVNAGGHFAAEYALQKVRFGVNLGGVYRPARTLLSTEVGSEMVYGGAAAFQATPLLAVIGEVTGATRFSGELDENPAEARIVAELTQGDIAITVGGGFGLVSGVGVPNFRALAGVSYRPAGLDSDGDGVDDKNDNCPAELEDSDGYLDEDGCPDLDNDADGLPDDADQCPDDAEDNDGTQDTDGCPDRDNDGDGIQDGYDSCPDEPEDKDGDRDDDGCPDNDRDRDGVSDDTDKCPDEPEDTDGFGDEDGCPETDFDGDNIPDDEDHCPDEAEDLDGTEDEDGCPDP